MNIDTINLFPGDKVLDIGSGNNPNSRATILMDRYIDDASHRSFEGLKTQGKPFIIANIEYLPFKNKSIDVIIANHIIEHVDDPVRACIEIQRVAKRGYIETPSPFLEQGYYIASDGSSHWEKHKWYVINPDQTARASRMREIGKKLIFQRKDPYFFDSSIHSHIIKQMLYDVRANFSEEGKSNDYINKIMDKFTPSVHHTIFHWDTSFSVEVRNEKGEIE